MSAEPASLPDFFPPAIAPGEKPKVSILLITYNHGRYIAQAIESILAQETEYTYRIHVIEDCSTDDTQAVVMRYAEKYPHVVIPFFNAVNIGRKVTQLNFTRGLRTMDGEYWCVLEGDDYWSSPHKLQKQVTFLETNAEFVGCAHNTVKIYEDGSKEPHRFLYWENMPAVHSIESFIRIESFFHASSMLFRNIYKGNPPDYFMSPWSCDIFMNIAHAQFGPIRFFDEDMSVYRAHGGGMFSNMETLNGWKFNVGGLQRYNSWLRYRYFKAFAQSISRYCRVILCESGKNGIRALTIRERMKYCAIFLAYGIPYLTLDGIDRAHRYSLRLLPGSLRSYRSLRVLSFTASLVPAFAITLGILLFRYTMRALWKLCVSPERRARIADYEKQHPEITALRLVVTQGNPLSKHGLWAISKVLRLPWKHRNV